MKYVPTPVPVALQRGLRAWLANELRRIAAAFDSVSALNLEQLAAEPDKLEDGMVVYANGTDWNPGSGAGIYGREGGAWVKL